MLVQEASALDVLVLAHICGGSGLDLDRPDPYWRHIDTWKWKLGEFWEAVQQWVYEKHEAIKNEISKTIDKVLPGLPLMHSI